MRPLRCAILLFASSMAVKTLLVALLNLYELITRNRIAIGLEDTLQSLFLMELVFFIPLYILYLPFFLYATRRRKTDYIQIRLVAFCLAALTWYLCAFYSDLMRSAEDALIYAGMIFIYMMPTVELHMYWSERKNNISAEELIKRKISRIFYWTGIPAALVAGIIMGVVGYIFIAIHSCIQVPACSLDFIIEGLSMSEYTFEIIGGSLLGGIISGLGFYMGILYPLYGFFIKRLWQQNKRSYAHFALAATTTIFWMGLSYFIFSPNFDDLERWHIFFFGYSYTALITSVIHLKILKEYDLRYGIPEEPPRAKRWYERFLGIKGAEVETTSSSP